MVSINLHTRSHLFVRHLSGHSDGFISRQLICGLLVTLAFALGSWSEAAQAQILTATVSGGEIQGEAENGVVSFKGIPFAAPPAGDLRWKAPQPVSPWNGIRKADAFGPSPMQESFLAALMGAGTNMSEDCLYLNVWTPAKKADEKLPVMVWIYGGAFVSGMTSAPLYDGANLARKGVVFVSLAYRVGAFGFLAHPELSHESGQGSGCYGLQDQVAGLQWVQRNIARFGGDPSRVTIFGESAGGISVCMLTVVPAAKGLFQRAIAESGASMAPIKSDSEAGLMVPSLKLAEKNGEKFLSRLGVSDIKAARALSAAAIQKGGVGLGQFWPAADGSVLPGDEYQLYQAGCFHDTPVLMGFNSDEGAMFVLPGTTSAGFEHQIRDKFGKSADSLLQVYRHATGAEAFKAAKDAFRDSTFAWPTWTWAMLRSHKSPHATYVYYFDHRIPSSPDGASHASEIGYVFGNLEGWGGGSRPEDLALSDMMSAYWINFAATGNPNGPGLPTWPTFSPEKMSAMVFDQTPSARPIPNLEKIKAFDAYFAWRRLDPKKQGPAGDTKF